MTVAIALRRAGPRMAAAALLLGCDAPLPHPPDPWVADPAGIGPLRTGMVLADAQARLGGSVLREDWAPENGCDYANLSAAPAGLALMLSEDTIVRIDVDSPAIRTREGAGVGDRESDVVARYAGYVRVEPHPYDGPEGHYLIVDLPGTPEYRMIFESDGTTVQNFRVGWKGAVDLIEGCS